MVKKIICDWCGGNGTVFLEYRIEENTLSTKDDRDLCEECLRKLLDFIEENDKIVL